MKSELDLQKDFINNPELQEQLEYLKTNPVQGMQGVVMVEAFLKGIRDLGYKDTSFAFNEINDNSIQAGARNIHYDLIGASNKIQEIIVYDDGHGMVPDMLRIAVAWGGGHRQGSRKGFGKYGYGLPSACLGMAKKYTVYSKTTANEWHSIIFDITSLDSDEKIDMSKIVSDPKPCQLPKHIAEFEGPGYKVSDIEHGTIIQMEEIDKVKPVQINALKNNFLNDFGQTYFKLLDNTDMYVDGQKVDKVDVLFATPGARGFKDPMNDLSVDINNPDCYGEISIPIKMQDDEETESEITVRWSKIPGLFAIKNPDDSGIESVEEAYIQGKTAQNADTKSYRWKVLRQNYGIVFRRFGRKMEVVDKSSKLGGFNLQNYSNYWKCEVNFPAKLDEHFEVTTTKQQITPSDKIIDTLKKAGVFDILTKLEGEYRDENKVRKSKRKNPEGTLNQSRESEILAEAAALVQGAEVATSEYQERTDKAKERKQKRIEDIASEKGISIEQAVTDYEVMFKDRPRVCNEIALGKSHPFLALEEHGETIEVKINTDHQFFKNFYCGTGANGETQSTWQLFLLLLADQHFKQDEDHQDYLESFLNKIGESMKVASRKNKERNGEEDPEIDDLSFMDEK
ncbi:ATP-binding protein [Alphaproteobacteria bacterium]|nr:ATP-binding protein [Alphaproteobacteria bacterium]